MKSINTIRRSTSNLTDTLIKLINEIGVSGHENSIRKVIKPYLGDISQLDIDEIGSLIALANGYTDSPRIAITAHMDEIGFEVQRINLDGTIYLQPKGIWWAPVPYGQQVLIDTGKRIVRGVTVTHSPWTITEREAVLSGVFDGISVDIGCRNKEEIINEFGIAIANQAVLYGHNRLLDGDSVLVGKALDDRIGCSLIIEILNHFAKEFHPNTLYGIFTTQEETGRLNSTVSGFKEKIDLCIVLDVGFGEPVTGNLVMRKGAALFQSDGVLKGHQGLIKYIISLAKQQNIPLQVVEPQSLENTFAGTALPSLFEPTHYDGNLSEERCLMREVPSVCIGIPTRYTHSPIGLVCIEDLKYTFDLLRVIFENLSSNVVKEILRDNEGK